MSPSKFSWSTLRKPFFVLAPMDGATDMVFRQVVADCGRPDVFVTEFTNVDGLTSVAGGREVAKRLRFSHKEHPIIAQIWGTNPVAFEKSAVIVRELGFDGIDINMGCPVRDVVKHGACSALIKTPDLAARIIAATKKGAGGLPVSVKTRIGFHTNELDTWIPFLLTQDLDALTLHFRTSAEMSLVPAHWEEAPKVVAYRDKIAPSTILIGNGDVSSVQDGEQKAKESGFDGIMIGRGVFHNPYVFNKDVNYQAMSREQKVALLRKHVAIFSQHTAIPEKHFLPLKRFFKIYIQGFDGASDLREELMQAKNLQEVYAIIA